MKKVIIRKTEEIENWRRNINSEINFIPTMGNLHDGHIKLITTAKNDNSNVNLVSIFVNPLQFDNKSDLENYPRTIDNDIKISFSTRRIISRSKKKKSSCATHTRTGL